MKVIQDVNVSQYGEEEQVNPYQANVGVNVNVSQYGATGAELEDLESAKLYANEAKEWAEKAEAEAGAAKNSEELARVYAAQAMEAADTAVENADESGKNAERAEAAAAAADNSAANANTSAVLAKESEDKAKASEVAAKASELAASASETNAKASEAAADADRVAAEAAKVAAEAAKTSAEMARDSSQVSAEASQASAVASQASAVASEESAKRAEASEDIAQGYVNAAKADADRAEAAATAAAASELSSENSAIRSDGSAAEAKVSEDRAAQSATEASESAGQSFTNMEASQNSANAAAASASAAATSETNASGSEASALASKNAAKVSETNAKTSETKAKTSETNASASELAASGSAGSAASSATAASTQAENAADSAAAALASQEAAKVSEDAAEVSQVAAAASESNAKVSETNAKASQTAAEGSATASANSATASSESASQSLASQNAAKVSEGNAEASEIKAKTSETNASNSAEAAKVAETSAEAEATKAAASAALAEEWAVSTETENSAKHWAEVAKVAATSAIVNGGLFTPRAESEYPSVPAGSQDVFWAITFPDRGSQYTYATGDLSGQTVKSQDSIYYTRASNKWDALLSSATGAVFEVNGKTGNSITLNSADVGAVSKAGDTMTGNLDISKSVPALFLTNTGDGNRLWKFEASTGQVRITEGGVGYPIVMKAGAETTIRKPCALESQQSHPNSLTRKDYVDGKFVSKSGDTMSGKLIIKTPATDNVLQLHATGNPAQETVYQSWYNNAGTTRWGYMGYSGHASSNFIMKNERGDNIEFFSKDTNATKGLRYNNNTVYHTGNKPTTSDIGAVSKAGDTMTGDLRISGVRSNSIPSDSQIKLDGYGLIGNREAIYVTNAKETGNIQLCVGGAHSANTKLKIEKTASTFYSTVLTTAAQSSASNSFTRRDYVDGRSWSKTEAPNLSHVGLSSDTKWKAAGAITSGTVSEDFNTLVKAGIYHKLLNNTSPNRPTGSTGYDYLMNFTYGTSGNLTQLAIPYGVTDTNGRLAYRTKFGSDWQPWSYIYSTANKPTWADIGGNGYWTKSGDGQTSATRYVHAGADNGGFYPKTNGQSALGASSWVFREAWVNSYRGGGVDITGYVKASALNNRAGINMIRQGGSGNATVVGNSTENTYIDTKDSIKVRKAGSAEEGHVYTTFQKPTAADIGAVSVDVGDARWMGKTAAYTKAESDGRFVNSLVSMGTWDTLGKSGFVNSSTGGPSGSTVYFGFTASNGTSTQHNTQLLGRDGRYFFRSREDGVNSPFYEIYHQGKKPTWTDVGGSEYFTKEGSSYIRTKVGFYNMCATGRGWFPYRSGTGTNTDGSLGNSSWWFKEAWVNSYRGGSVDVSGIVSATGSIRSSSTFKVVAGNGDGDFSCSASEAFVRNNKVADSGYRAISLHTDGAPRVYSVTHGMKKLYHEGYETTPAKIGAQPELLTPFSTKHYSVSSTNHAELKRSGDQVLAPNSSYFVRLATNSTGTQTGAVYTIRKDSAGVPTVRLIANKGTGSNHPKLIVKDDDKVYVATDHGNNYTVTVFMQEFITYSHNAAFIDIDAYYSQFNKPDLDLGTIGGLPASRLEGTLDFGTF